MIVEEVQAQLGAVAEVGQVELEIEAELAAVAGCAVRQAVHGLEVRNERPAEGAEVHALVGELPEAQHHFLAARHAEIVGAEVRAVRLGTRLVPLEQVKKLRAQAVAEPHVEHRHLIG